jgi:hypothetical protein
MVNVVFKQSNHDDTLMEIIIPPLPFYEIVFIKPKFIALT